MKSLTREVIVLALAVLSISLGPGCGSGNEGGVNATQSIKDPNGPKSQEEYARKQLENSTAAKKAAGQGK